MTLTFLPKLRKTLCKKTKIVKSGFGTNFEKLQNFFLDKTLSVSNNSDTEEYASKGNCNLYDGRIPSLRKPSYTYMMRNMK